MAELNVKELSRELQASIADIRSSDGLESAGIVPSISA